MKLAITVLILCLILVQTNGQFSERGIQFEKGLIWQQALDKAKKEGKYIFVDCYATWCKPCAKMDMNVYPDPAVGETVNPKFISVKIQMDTAKYDNEKIKTLYPAARTLEKAYGINSLPTYLFFSPDGNIVHKGTGAKTVSDFIKLINDAADTSKQMFTMVRNALLGKLPDSALVRMAYELNDQKEDSLAKLVARSYYNKCLAGLPDKNFLNKENLIFLSSFLSIINSNDRIFHMYREKSQDIDSIMLEKGYAKARMNRIIYLEEILPFVEKARTAGNEPDWKKISNKIRQKYGRESAIRNVWDGQATLYHTQKKWNAYKNVMIKKWETYPQDFERASWLLFNRMAWIVCAISNKQDELNLALIWVNRGLQQDQGAGILDTKACILYQMGNKSEAIKIAKEVLRIIKEEDYTYTGETYRKNITATFQKRVDQMENNETLHLNPED
jgi:thioredoxin-related protein